ncbi:Mu-type opioid receptor [Holothuria leucospilota]|uniref:Mu-type opioid receptor n=1 Tax=Holothuria leucospilota TaxID=206669 RepID=A0A9Q0YQ19_HOLLE|nr:Mu-type opioid receptor [Holothuria leucospilota]
MESTDFLQIGFTTSSLLETSVSTLNASLNGTTEGPPWVFDDINQRIVVAALLFVIAVFGLTGNILTIVAVILSKKLHTIANVFVVNLTIAGGLSCATLPFTIANMIANTDKGIIPDGLCTFVSLMSYFSFSGTIVSHALIAFDRYYRITKPCHKYHKMFTKCRITIFIICAWIYANISVLFAIITNVNIMYSQKYRVCLPDIVDPDVAKVSLFRATTIDLFILILVMICYTAMFIYIYRHNKKLLGMFNVSKTEGVNLRTTLNARQVKITMNMFLVVAVYVVCITPYVVCLIVDSLETIFPYVAVFYALSNAINPAIYAWKHPYFRAVFKPMIQLKCSKIPNPSPILKFFTGYESRRNRMW